METKHTPGLWMSMENGRDTYIYKEHGNHKNSMIGKVSKQQKEFESNAQLMATAPELLETLIEIREWYEANHEDHMGTDTPICFSKGLSAIQKATS